MKPGEFVSSSVANVTTFQTKLVTPPSSLYIQRDDQFLFQAASNQAAEIVTFNVRLMLITADGTTQIQSIQLTNAPPLLRASNSITTNLAEGYLLSVTANVAVANQRGQTFVRASINRGGGPLTRGWLALLADYATIGGPVSWPGGRVISPVEGPGWLRGIVIAAPAAGTDWSFPLLTGQRLRLQSLRAAYIASVAVANRQPELIINDSAGGLVWRGPVIANITAGVGAEVIGAPFAPYTPINATRFFLSFPGSTFLSGLAGHILSTTTVGIQPADFWASIVLAVEEWLEL